MSLEKWPAEPAEGNRLNFDMVINDFGPIKKAAISLRPLTIFIGGNDTGKSYAAMLAHSVMSTGGGLDCRAHLLRRPLSKQKSLEKTLSGMEKILSGLKPASEVKCPARLTAQIVRSCVDRYRVHLEREIVRNLGSDLRDLARSGAGHFLMTVEAENRTVMSYSKKRLTLSLPPKLDIEAS